VANGFKINKSAIRKMTQEIEREFAKNPVRVPLEADPTSVFPRSATTVNNYHGPVVTVNGDNSQIAWGNVRSEQTQNPVEQIAPGFVELARLITDLLANLDVLGLDKEDTEEARTNAETVLTELVKIDPSTNVIKRGLTMLKGLLAPVATGIGVVVTEESSEAARRLIDALGTVFH